ncbi:MAG: malate dehydrogenase [Candidatus Melainabacteria bacterium RIFCSPHIGHO2_02_FULL_34_12]|nr:MAG: malate dehydrogenase [Candidatus Melainabacteria bacterium RIFCSPHIGHO2_02_FULL_34_12]
MRLNSPSGSLSEIAAIINSNGGHLGDIKVVESNQNFVTRDVYFSSNTIQAREIISKLHDLPGTAVIDAQNEVYNTHIGGKIGIQLKKEVNNYRDLSVVYTPGVAEVCRTIHQDPKLAYNLTIKKNSVAVITDGTAVLGLGNIGPYAAMPVMEGKAMLFKMLADVDAYPICLDAKTPDEIVQVVKAIAPGFGGINLEDIAAPKCFEIERRLQNELDIPIFHDDQHGTAVVVTAALLNAVKVVNKKLEDLEVVITGAGAAGVSCAKMLLFAGVRNIIVTDRNGAIYMGRKEMNSAKEELAQLTNPTKQKGGISDVIKGADVFIGVSGPNLVSVDDIKLMAKDSIVFALSNPDPEIKPELAKPYVRIMATGRSDYPNQINNVLCFPGFFRGLLDSHATTVTEKMKFEEDKAIASIVQDYELNESCIIPNIFNKKVASAVASAVADAACEDRVTKVIPEVDLKLI